MCAGPAVGSRLIFLLLQVSEGHQEQSERTVKEAPMDGLASEKGDTSNGPQELYEKLLISRPNNAYEFGQVINAISTRKDQGACAHLLAITEPKDLPVLLSNKLEGDTFLLLLQSLKSHLIDKDPSLVYQHLLYLSKAERFKVSGKNLSFVEIGSFRVFITLKCSFISWYNFFPIADDVDTN